MPALGLALLALYGLLAFGARMALQVHWTGSTGFKGLGGTAGTAQRIGGLLFAASIALCVAGPALQLAGALDTLPVLDGKLASAFGVALAVAGIALTLVAQIGMGDAWRVGVDPEERTELVTGGPFSHVRNPIYTAMAPSFAGIALLAPNPVTIAGAVLLAVALTVHTRVVEEPYLLAVHGDSYAVYAAQVGRFLPGIGCLRPSESGVERRDRAGE
jgi:protein-S-isoprenylcysteine O-methyltransferase Ste14